MHKHSNQYYFVVGIILFLLIYIIIKALMLFTPWTKWEAFHVLEYGGSPSEIALSLDYLGDTGKPEYIEYLMDYISDCRPVGHMNRRNFIIKFPMPIAYIANKQLERITKLDFGYDIIEDCDSFVNQNAIKGWEEWYENDYNKWLKNRLAQD